MEITQRLIAPSEIDATLDFFKTNWGERHILARDRAFLEWQLSPERSEAFKGAGLAALACFDGERMVGMVGMQATDFNCDGDVAPGVWLTNLMSAPDYVAHGVGAKLMTGAHRMPFTCYALIGINLAVIPMYRAMRYHCADATPRYVRIVDAEAARPLVAGDGAAAYLTGARVPHGRGPAGVSLTEGPPPQDWDAFWSAYTRLGYYGVHRDAAFLTWRYMRHPRFDYRLLFARDEAGRLLGAAVYRIERIMDRAETVLRCIEIIAPTAQGWDAVLAGCEKVALAHGAAFIDHYTTRPNVEALRARGYDEELSLPGVVIPCLFQPFVPSSRKMNWATRVVGSHEWKDRDWRAHVHIAKSDGDQDRPN